MEGDERKLNNDELLMCNLLGLSTVLQTEHGAPVLTDYALKGRTFDEVIKDSMGGRVQLTSVEAIDKFLDDVCRNGRRPVVEARRAAIRALLVEHLGSHEDNS